MAAILEDDAFAEALRGRAGLIAVLDSLQLSGSFAVPYWIKICAERGVRTIVVAVQSSAERYRQLLKRLGLNAGQLVDSQHLCILEPEPPSTSDSDGYLRGLLGRIEGEIEAMAAAAASCSGAPATPVARAASSSAVAAVSVIIDGLSELHGLGWRPHDWHAFLHYLRAAGSRAGLSRRRYSCLAVAHRDVAEDARWLALLQHAAGTYGGGKGR